MQAIRSVLPVLALALAALTPAFSRAETPTPDVVLATAVDEVLAIAYAPAQTSESLAVRVRPTLERYFLFDAITRRAVGPGWRQFTPEEQRRVTDLFTDLVIRTYADKFTPGERPRISWSAAADLGNGRREIPSRVVYAGASYAVSYRMEASDGSWRIYDVVIEGVSMIANYRAQFDALVRKGGAAEVIRVLEGKLTPAVASS